MIKHSLANYPKQFLGCVVSPTKICLQFEDVQVKLRFKEGAQYVKMLDTSKALPISTLGTDVELTSVGCQMPVIEDLQLQLIEAYAKYALNHSATYSAEYNKQFLDFLIETRERIDNAISKLTCKD